jgi:fucose 4-O-acetylase-like acetyltransferase
MNSESSKAATGAVALDTAVRRVQIVDIAKGIAILLMVYGHTEQGGMHRQWWVSMPRFVAATRFSDAFVYSFHMAVFFFVAGLFITQSIVRRGGSTFLMEKIKTILYPYLLWGFLFGLTEPFTTSLRSGTHAFSWSGLWMGLLTGDSSWFLATLFMCQILALAIYRLPHWAQMAIALAACYLVPEFSVTVLSRPFFFFPFMVAGMWFGSQRLSLLTDLRRWQAALGFAALFVVQFAIIWLTGPVSRWDRFPVGLCGIAMLLLLGQVISETFISRVFIWFGEASLSVFLFAAFFQVFNRELLLRVFHTTAPLPQVFVASLVTPIVPALLWHYQKQLHISWFFRWPSWKKSVKPANAQTATA